MCDPRVIMLVREIHDLHARMCDRAGKINAALESDAVRLKERCRPRENGRVPEAHYFSDVFDFQTALSQVWKDPKIAGRMRIVQMTLSAAALVFCLYAVRGSYSLTMIGAVVFVGAAGFCLLQNFWLRPLIQRGLREQLLKRGVPICLACGYDLRGQTDPRCPECGESFAPPVISVDGRVAANSSRPARSLPPAIQERKSRAWTN